MGPPVGWQPVAPPCVSELAQLDHGQGCAGFPSTEPAINVHFRPEEVHGASGEDDVVPPMGGWNEAVEEEALVAGSFVADLHVDNFAAVGA